MSTIISRSLDTTVGPRFLSISNTDLLGLVRETAAPFGISEQDVRVVGNDRRMIATVTLPNLAFAGSEGLLIPRLFVRNENTGGRAMSIGVGLFRMICSNGLMLGVPGMSFSAKVRHVDGPKAHGLLDILPSIFADALRFIGDGELENEVDAAREVEVYGTDHAIQIVGNLPTGQRIKDSVVDALIMERYRPEDAPTSAWNVYNLVNEHTRARSRSELAALTKDENLLSDVMLLAAG